MFILIYYYKKATLQHSSSSRFRNILYKDLFNLYYWEVGTWWPDTQTFLCLFRNQSPTKPTETLLEGTTTCKMFLVIISFVEITTYYCKKNVQYNALLNEAVLILSDHTRRSIKISCCSSVAWKSRLFWYYSY